MPQAFIARPEPALKSVRALSPGERAVALRDEVALLEPVFARAGEPFDLVAHSYGAAVALIAAVSQPRRIRALALYEPTLFALLDAEAPPPNAADGIRATVAAAAAALEAGNPQGAAECFIDYWMGAGSWARMPESRQGPITTSIGNVRGWAGALLGEPTALAAFAELDIPLLYMLGKDSPASSLGGARLQGSGVSPATADKSWAARHICLIDQSKSA